MATQVTPARPAWWRFRGWWAVLAGGLHGFMGYGVLLYSWSAFVSALMKDFKWSAVDMGAVASFGRLMGMIANPLGGTLTDRIGPRLNGLLWMTLGAIGLFGLSTVNELWMVFLFYGVIMYSVMNAGLYRVSWVAVNRWFIRRRAAAIGWVTVGTGLGSTIMVPLSGILIVGYGWRMAAIILGVIWSVVTIPLCFLFLSRMPEHYGMRPDNESPEDQAARASQAATQRSPAPRTTVVDLTVRDALRGASFWILAVASVFGSIGGILPVFQNVRMLSLGFSIDEAAFYYGLNFAFTTVGRGSVALFGDWVSARLAPRFGIAVCYIGEAVGVLLFALAFNSLFIWGWVVLYGVAYGASIPYVGYLYGSYWGRANYGTLWGIMGIIQAAASAVMPVFVGWLTVVTAGWTVPFLVAAGGYAMAGVVIVFAIMPKQQREGQAAAAARPS